MLTKRESSQILKIIFYYNNAFHVEHSNIAELNENISIFLVIAFSVIFLQVWLACLYAIRQVAGIVASQTIIIHSAKLFVANSSFNNL